jgi:hypothetical protein
VTGPILARAVALAEGIDRSATQLATLAHDQNSLSQVLVLAAHAIDRLKVETAALADALAQPVPPPPENGPWGRGRASGMPWWSGMAWRGNAASWQAFVAGPRNGVGCDLLQLFGPSSEPLAHSWDALAGGAGDSPETTDGVLTFSKGSKQGQVLWGDPATRALPIAYTIRPVPIDPAASNEDGRNPGTWESIAKGEHDDVWRRLGMRLAYQDQKWGRTAPLVLEIGHEMSGAWYQHSIHGQLPDGRWCYEIFPTAWARIVENIRAGCLKQAGKQCPYLFIFRPGRCALPAGVRLDRYLPPPGTWDAIGITCHDNQPWCTTTVPRACWTPALDKSGSVDMEGLELLAEVAEKYRKGIAIVEWAPYPPESTTYRSGPDAGIFVQAMFDFFREHSHLVACECYFEREACSLTSRPDWSATQAYRRLWGTAG